MNKEYWEKYYARKEGIATPSLFAQYVRENVIGKRRDLDQINLIELGCGNGRDSIYFAAEGLNVSAIDQCKKEIESLRQRTADMQNIIFRCADFSSLEDKFFNIVYSRFTLHSISKYQQNRLIKWVSRNLVTFGGVFCIETRGQKNELYKKGILVEGESDAYIFDNHYRRFLNFEELCHSLEDSGFILRYADEKKGFAPYKESNETYIRVIAEKTNKI
ncbi:MAG: class I SAM-dependent methyltransferase [Tannerellaceae bacterium]|jgi:tellurite methyltransferase|nr:class I SAM-dependent methyltransferase [Tannerellaceae bacterium]